MTIKNHLKHTKTLKSRKKYIYVLTEKYGLGKSLALQICSEFWIPPYLDALNIEKQLQADVENWIKINFKTGRALSLETNQNIKDLVKNKSRRGYRHLWSLPVRGQRSKTNGRTQKKRKIKM